MFPYLTGLAQMAYCNLDLEQVTDYKQAKSTILDYLDMSEESHHHHFGAKIHSEGTRLCVVVQCLKEHCWKWLHLDEQSRAQVVYSSGIEQFIRTSPAKGRDWVFSTAWGTCQMQCD